MRHAIPLPLLLLFASLSAPAAPPLIQGAQGEVPLVSLDGREGKLRDFGKKVTVVSFWGTFCGPCLDELPALEKVQQKYRADPDVAFLAVSIDPSTSAEDRAKIKALADKLGLTMPVVADRGPLAAKLLQDDPTAPPSGQRPNLSLPLLVIIDPAFHVYRERGWQGADGFVEKHAALIEQAKVQQLPPDPPPPNMPRSDTGRVKWTFPKMTNEQWEAKEPQLRAMLQKAFPYATDAQLRPVLAKAKATSRKGGEVELAVDEKLFAAVKLGREADGVARADPKRAMGMYLQAYAAGLRDPGFLYNAACTAALAGDKEAAFTWMGRVADAGFSDAKWVQKDDDLVSLRADPRFAGLIRRLEANEAKKLSAEGAKDPALQKELLALVEEDQIARQALIDGKLEASQKVADIDRRSTARMKEILAAQGWPGRSLVGERAAHAAWLLVQHADKDAAFQKQCLPLIEEAVKKGEASGKDLAYLTDRVLVADHQPQRYGTQFHMENGQLVPQPMEDPAHVDDRRRAVGLGTLDEYRAQMKQVYRPALERQDAGTR